MPVWEEKGNIVYLINPGMLFKFTYIMGGKKRNITVYLQMCLSETHPSLCIPLCAV